MSDLNAIKNEFNISLGLFGSGGKEAVDTLLSALGNERSAHEKSKADLAILQHSYTALATTAEAQKKLIAAVRLLSGQTESELWLRQPVGKPTNYEQRLQESIPIMVFANLKGGVAKTTLSANIAAYFETIGERVLVIDLDFQGSLTSMLRPHDPLSQSNYAHSAMMVLSPDFHPDQLLSHAPQVRNSKRDSRFISCGQEFANYEMALLLRWIIGDVQADISYCSRTYY
jgi:hypothetical protein